MRQFLFPLPFGLLLFILPFPGTVALRLLCLAAAFLLVLWSWRRLVPPPVPARAALLLWVAVALASLATAVDVAYSAGEIKNEIGYTMMAFLAFFAVTQERFDLQRWSVIVVASAVTISVWASLAFLKVGHWDDRGTYGGIGTYASLAVAAVPMLLVCWSRASARGRVGVAAALAAIAIASLLSQQRILWVVFGAQFAVAMWLLGSTGRDGRGRVKAIVIIAGALVLAGGALYVSHKAKFSQSRAELQVIENDYRLMHWKRVFERIQAHPLAGAGFGRDAMKKAYPDLVPVGEPQSLLWHPHNVFLNYGIAMGWPGMLALAILFMALLREYWRHLRGEDPDRRVVAVAGMLLVIGVVGRNLTNDFFVRDGALMFWALNGAMLGYLARGTRAASPAEKA